MSEARVGRISNENSTAGPIISGITTFSGQNYFVPPKGTTAERPSNCPVGSIRFNTDSAKLEYFDGLQWLELEAFNVEIGQAGALGNRGVFGGGLFLTPLTTRYNVIEYITISTAGNAIDFGDLTNAESGSGACSSSTRGVFGGGSTPTLLNTIEYVTIASTGNALDFGDLTGIRNNLSACSSSTRGVFGGGVTATPTTVYLNIIEYITISSTGNSIDFGDLTVARGQLSGCSSQTRGVFGGGTISITTYRNIIDYITISSTGNAIDFGDLSISKNSLSSFSNSIRGVFGGGYTPTPVATRLNVIEYITISSTGNAIDFGDLSVGKSSLGACSSSTRGVFGGGTTPTPATTYFNVIEYITISSTGDAIDFGDLTLTKSSLAGCSNGHGGL